MSLRVGLTGGIGSGKSTVAALLAGHGAVVIDTDLIARQLTLPGGAAIAAIAASFGPAFIDPTGALDRARMRDHAFSDDAARQRLEAILHPLIGIETARQAEAPDALAASLVVFDVPLLVESGRWRARVDKVLVVDCTEATQIARVTRRSGWSRSAVRAVIERQATRMQRLACADASIYNDAITPDRLALEVLALWRQWGAPAGAGER